MDRNAKEILQIEEGDNLKKTLTETHAVDFSLNGNVLIYTDPIDYTFNRLDLISGEQTTAKACTICKSKRITGFVVWGCVIIGTASAILLIITLTRFLVIRRKA